MGAAKRKRLIFIQCRAYITFYLHRVVVFWAKGNPAAVGVAGEGMPEQAPPSMHWNSAHAAAGELVWLPHLLLC